MPSYLKSEGSAGCGPCAFVNLFKWLGLKEFNGEIVNKHLQKTTIATLLRALNNIGTAPKYMTELLNRLVKKRVLNYLTCTPLYYSEMQKACSNQNSCIMFVYSIYSKKTKTWDSHACLVTDFDGEYYTTINMNYPLVDVVSVKEMKTHFKKNAMPSGYIIWRKSHAKNNSRNNLC